MCDALVDKSLSLLRLKAKAEAGLGAATKFSGGYGMRGKEAREHLSTIAVRSGTRYRTSFRLSRHNTGYPDTRKEKEVTLDEIGRAHV